MAPKSEMCTGAVFFNCIWIKCQKPLKAILYQTVILKTSHNYTHFKEMDLKNMRKRLMFFSGRMEHEMIQIVFKWVLNSDVKFRFRRPLPESFGIAVTYSVILKSSQTINISCFRIVNKHKNQCFLDFFILKYILLCNISSLSDLTASFHFPPYTVYVACT